jgi:hypothetical protein
MRKFLFITLLILAACGASAGSPAKAIETYLNALVARNENAVVSASCASWEASARQEYNSFAAVTLEAKDLVCQAAGADGDYTLVNCTGVIIANYGNEDLQIDVAERSYRAIQEGGEWRMCGYGQ